MRNELSRPVEPDHGLMLIMLERGFKGLILIVAGFVLYKFGNEPQLRHNVNQMLYNLSLNIGVSWWRRTYEQIVIAVGLMPYAKQDALVIGTLLFGALQWVECVGLADRRRWAEYLVLLSTSALLPLEVIELIDRVTPTKGGIFVINLLIVGYLIWHKKPFRSE